MIIAFINNIIINVIIVDFAINFTMIAHRGDSVSAIFFDNPRHAGLFSVAHDVLPSLTQQFFAPALVALALQDP